jgi:prolyl-tRNA synthetase
VTIGRRTLENGEIEVQVRRGQDSRTLPLEDAASAIADLWRALG